MESSDSERENSDDFISVIECLEEMSKLDKEIAESVNIREQNQHLEEMKSTMDESYKKMLLLHEQKKKETEDRKRREMEHEREQYERFKTDPSSLISKIVLEEDIKNVYNYVVEIIKEQDRMVNKKLLLEIEEQKQKQMALIHELMGKTRNCHELYAKSCVKNIPLLGGRQPCKIRVAVNEKPIYVRKALAKMMVDGI
jgi:hypothetical protein